MTCGSCHVAIYKEWEQSPHAKAYLSQTFRHATNDYKFHDCIACHAPEPMLTTTRPTARTAECNLGVVCVTCHLNHGSMVGPHQPTGVVRPHPILVDASRFANGQLCGRCHESTLSQWNAFATAGKQDCSTCHMPEVTRTMTQATDLISKPIVAMEKPGVEHRHLFSCAAAVAGEKSYALRATRTGPQLTLTLQNLLPHNLPTGDFGVRIVELDAYAVNASGRQSPIGTWEIDGVLNESLAPGASRTWETHLPADIHQVELVLTHKGRELTDSTVVLRKTVVLE